MLVFREARGDDFERVYPLLLEFNNPYLTKEDWRQLFIDHSGLQNDRFGWLLADGDNVVGFAGTILSERMIRGEKVRLSNVSGWIVQHEYRAHSLALHAKAVADKSLNLPVEHFLNRPHVNAESAMTPGRFSFQFPVSRRQRQASLQTSAQRSSSNYYR